MVREVSCVFVSKNCATNMPAVDETAERKLSAKVSRPILSCKHGSWDTWNVLMKNYINVHDGWNEIVFENRLKDVAKKRLPSKPAKVLVHRTGEMSRACARPVGPRRRSPRHRRSGMDM